MNEVFVKHPEDEVNDEHRKSKQDRQALQRREENGGLTLKARADGGGRVPVGTGFV